MQRGTLPLQLIPEKVLSKASEFPNYLFYSISDTKSNLKDPVQERMSGVTVLILFIPTPTAIFSFLHWNIHKLQTVLLFAQEGAVSSSGGNGSSSLTRTQSSTKKIFWVIKLTPASSILRIISIPCRGRGCNFSEKLMGFTKSALHNTLFPVRK